MAHKFGIGIGSDPNLRITSELSEIQHSDHSDLNSDHSDRSQAFTLIELLVSVSIFAIITTAVVANFRVGQRSSELRLAAEQVASALRSIQTMSQTGKRVQLCDDCVDQVPLGGYGARVTSDGFVFFADVNNTLKYEPGEEITDVLVNVPGIVNVRSLSTDIGADMAEIEFVFSPPLAELYINACGTEETLCPVEARITLQHSHTGQTRAVVVRRVSGRINVE